MKVSRWGNSLAVRLPASVVEDLALKPGDELSWTVHRPYRVELARKSKNELLAEMRRLQRPSDTDYVFDRDEANSRGGSDW